MRESRQRDASDSFVGDEWSMIKAAPRFGKIKVTLDILKRLGSERVLIAFPRVDIQDGWESDMKKWGYDQKVTFTTFRSLSKHTGEKWDFVVIDEIHEASQAQLREIKRLKSPNVLGLSGTVTATTEKQIYYLTGIVPCYEYSIDQAVEEGILCDYSITIHKVPLDNVIKTNGKTEKRKFEALAFVAKQLELQKKDTFHVYIKQIQALQGSYAKKQRTKYLLDQWKHERVLIFCGTTAVADDLGCPVYHSKAKEKAVFEGFCQGKDTSEPHLATIKMAQAGVTVKPIKKGLINYTSGNPEDTAQKICRFLGLEYDNPDKVADIHLIVADVPFETNKMRTSLMFFDETKVKGL